MIETLIHTRSLRIDVQNMSNEMPQKHSWKLIIITFALFHCQNIIDFKDSFLSYESVGGAN
jgi:hypothetical protein